MTTAVVNIFESGFIFYRLLLMESECWDGAQACPNHANIKKALEICAKQTHRIFDIFGAKLCFCWFSFVFIVIFDQKLSFTKKQLNFHWILKHFWIPDSFRWGPVCNSQKKWIPDSFPSNSFSSFFFPRIAISLEVSSKQGFPASNTRSRQYQNTISAGVTLNTLNK